MGTILTLLNFVLLLFWLRLWVDPRREFYFNPFLSGPVRLVDAVTGALGLPAKLTALIILGFGLLLRAALVFRSGYQWTISLGSIYIFAPLTNQVPQLLAFSLLDFLLFVLRIWSAYLFIRLITPANRSSRALEAFDFAVRPFSLMSPMVRLGLLILAHLLIAFELSQSASMTLLNLTEIRGNMPQLQVLEVPAEVARILRLSWMAAASFIDGLNAMRSALVAFVLGSLLAMVFRNNVMRQICNEGLNVLMGRFARSPFAPGTIDFTPLIFFFALQIIYGIGSSLLWTLSAIIS